MRATGKIKLLVAKMIFYMLVLKEWCWLIIMSVQYEEIHLLNSFYCSPPFTIYLCVFLCRY